MLLLLPATYVFAQVGNTSFKKEIPQSLDSLGNKVMKLMEFYESYDNGSPESLKKAKYEDAVDELFGGAATKKDKADAYQIIDAYIKGDKALEQDKPQQDKNVQSFDDALKNTKEVKAAQQFLDQQKNMFMQMSYSEFEASILKFNPVAGNKEIKTAYNQMHQNDGKQVTITAADEEMTEAQLQIWAIGAIQNPKNFDEFQKAYKIIKPNATEKEIREIWEKR
jgi:hypothetical protein